MMIHARCPHCDRGKTYEIATLESYVYCPYCTTTFNYKESYHFVMQR